jgi:hypothetical protein
MKILLFLILSYSSVSNAGVGDILRLLGGDSSGGSSRYQWSEILENHKKFDPKIKDIKFANRSLPITDLCYIPELEQFRSKERITMANGAEAQFLYTDIVYDQEVCAIERRKGCVRYETRWYRYPIIFNIEVLGKPRGDHSFGRLLFKKKYSIQDCSH